MKRKSLAFVLALIMILTLVPASAFAATSNSVDKVPTVAKDSDFSTTLSFKVGPGNFTSTAQAIKLTLENAEWKDGDGAKVNTGNNNIIVAVDGATLADADAISVTDSTAEIMIETDANLEANDFITLTLALTSGSDDGEVKVKVDGLDSSISGGTYTVAVVGTGKTTASVPGKLGSTWRTASFVGAPIEIRENAVNAVDSATPQTLRLTLPSGMSWVGVTSSGNLGTAVAASPDGRNIEVTVTPSPNGTLRQVLTLIPEIAVSKDAKMGDITVTIRNITTGLTSKSLSNASALVIGKYVDESVTVTTVKEKDLPEFIAGRVDADYEVEVTVEEVINSALAAGRFIDFEFPEWVQITSDAAVTVDATVSTGEAWDNADGIITEDTSSFEYTLSPDLSNTTKDKLVFTIPVTIDAAAPAGDVVLKVSGAKAGLADTKLVVGKVVKPVTVEVKTTDVKTGIQNQALGEIIIKENFEGALLEDSLVVTLSKDLGAKIKNAKAEVVSGDIEIGELKTDGNKMTIAIKSESVSKPAEIKISGATVTLDRTPAQGKYKVSVGGKALVENDMYLNYDATDGGDFADNVASVEYVNVVTPAGQGTNSTFVIGSKAYVVNGAERTMDVAPYTDASWRTMMPIRYVADALGISEDQIVWNPATQTATIFGEKVVTITAGKNQITAGGTTVTMDTVAVTKDGRMFVPARFVANALGASVGWDAATKTVSVYTVK